MCLTKHPWLEELSQGFVQYCSEEAWFSRLWSMQVRHPVLEAVLLVARTTVFGQKKTCRQLLSKGTSKDFPTVSAMVFMIL
jgi:hypothetical protein